MITPLFHVMFFTPCHTFFDLLSPLFLFISSFLFSKLISVTDPTPPFITHLQTVWHSPKASLECWIQQHWFGAMLSILLASLAWSACYLNLRFLIRGLWGFLKVVHRLGGEQKHIKPVIFRLTMFIKQAFVCYTHFRGIFCINIEKFLTPCH